MSYQTFEDYLRALHASLWGSLLDFDDWCENLEFKDWVVYGNAYADEREVETVKLYDKETI